MLCRWVSSLENPALHFIQRRAAPEVLFVQERLGRDASAAAQRAISPLQRCLFAWQTQGAGISHLAQTKFSPLKNTGAAMGITELQDGASIPGAGDQQPPQGRSHSTTLLLEEVPSAAELFSQRPEPLSNSLSNCISGYWRCMHQGLNHIINIGMCPGSRVTHTEVIAALGITVFKSLVLD